VSRVAVPPPCPIPLRECLNATIGELLRRRTTQEQARRTFDKLASIQRQCGRVDLPEDHLERLASDTDTVLNDLSATKQADIDRERQTELFRRGVLILNALLESIDETRLRPT
jgi:ketopantoate reductase